MMRPNVDRWRTAAKVHNTAAKGAKHCPDTGRQLYIGGAEFGLLNAGFKERGPTGDPAIVVKQMAKLRFVVVRLFCQEKLNVTSSVRLPEGMDQPQFLKDFFASTWHAHRGLRAMDEVIALLPNFKDLGHEEGQHIGHPRGTRDSRRWRNRAEGIYEGIYFMLEGGPQIRAAFQPSVSDFCNQGSSSSGDHYRLSF
eukprot:scaffold3515_cov126-Cylindrotheca_fusiformis.AAC.40